ncbi:dihydroorotase [Tropicimonas sp. IMCC6043]|uniref:dihydroorotase n=1 Tax=Tropicimonas sp. IMCC6043 TaxID=2510645 RepID=UPI00101DD9A6|nr:dihydroorotase [Tropicimonas sp. IMCC6043]RYH10628.1 dihydroorotase [Tropicimonas sp. IMCC6043]
MTQTLTLRRPDDWHLHLRDGAMLKAVLPDTARDFARAIIMPNLVPPVVTAADAAAYRDRIRAALPEGADFTPLMTLYLTETTDPADVVAAHAEGLVTAVKLYPAGATTNSDSGVRDMRKVQPVFEAMAEAGIPLCVHGEVTRPEIDIFDREAVFIEEVLDPIRTRTPGLRVVMEHITTADACAYLRDGGETLGATITTHHLMINRNHILVGGIRPHYYCLPVAKRERHREALVDLATSGFDRVFLGTDSAPHTQANKETACGCAGIYSAPVTMPCLAQVFEDAGALDRLEAFASLNGPAFYGMAPNAGTMTLEKGEPLEIPAPLATGDGPVIVFDPGRPVLWRVVG